MSLDIILKEIPAEPIDVFNGNITHNVTPIWKALNIYELLYNSYDVKAIKLLKPLQKAYTEMITHKEKYQQLVASNTWGTYNGALLFLKSLIENIQEHPRAKVYISI